MQDGPEAVHEYGDAEPMKLDEQDRFWQTGQWENDSGVPEGFTALVDERRGGIIAYFPDHNVACQIREALNGTDMNSCPHCGAMYGAHYRNCQDAGNA